MEGGVASVGMNQFLMRSVLDEASPVDREDAVGAAYRRKAVSDHDSSAPLADAPHVVLDDPLALVVERARRLVEDQDARVGDEGAGDCDPLPLSAREAAAALADERIVAFGKLKNEFMCAGKRRRGNDLIHRQRRVRERDIVAHGAIEKHVFLQNDADLAAQPGCVDHGKIDAVNEYAAGLRHIEALDKLGECAFART